MFRFENFWLLNKRKVVSNATPPSAASFLGMVFFMSENMTIKIFKYFIAQSLL